MKDKIQKWLKNGAIGISSKTMAFVSIGAPLEREKYNHPRDPSDFNRCLQLLVAVPEIRNHFDNIAALSQTWAALIARWDEVEKCFIDEVGANWCKGTRAPKTYRLMKDIGC